MLAEGKTYPLFGVHYFAYQMVWLFSNSRVYNVLFGDSSYIVFYLRLLGYKLNEVEQTGSNFGTNQKHDVPFLCDVGSGTMISDGLSMINVEMSSSAFKLGTVKIGERNYLGNNIHYPASSKVGSNCLLGTKAMVPIDGIMRENIGLLGSPCFEIPRSVGRDEGFNAFLDTKSRMERIRRKNYHNLVTVAIFTLCNWFLLFVTLLVESVSIVYYNRYGLLPLIIGNLFIVVFGTFFYTFLERATLKFGRLEPRIVSIYDEYFWFHERHWKFCGTPLKLAFKGTPLRNFVSWLQGVRIGRKVFDDGCQFTEKTMIEVGDYTNLNAFSAVQGHSLEEAVFKSDRIKIGRGCSLDCGAFVHYGVQMGDGVVLHPDSFLMKGEVLEPSSIWRGNPARVIHQR